MIHLQPLSRLAATIWYSGSVFLLLKAADLIMAAGALRPAEYCHLIVPCFGLPFGLLKGYTLFSTVCQKNLLRIRRLARPHWWQCYSARFFLTLVLMIAAGAGLSRLATGNYWLLCGVAALDIGIATALLTGGRMFWTRKTTSLSSSTPQP